ncbi:MAG TPA: NUDIX domain-containing protein [Candidatus Saccharimonadales bacterium]|nr:NUDIX domain-containing protein [Candidatus Saccharimonadales bacterium]
MIEVCVIWLTLPNGDVVLQRRDRKTNVSPGMLGLFGGHIEAGESPEEAMKRELSEETSLDVSGLSIDFVVEAELPHPNDSTVMRKIYFYKATVGQLISMFLRGKVLKLIPFQNLKSVKISPQVCSMH